MVLIGYEIFITITKLAEMRFITPICFIIYVVSNFIRFTLQENLIKNGLTPDYFLHTGKLIGVVSAISLFVCFYTIEISYKYIVKAVCYNSSKSFYIYLIQWAVIIKLDSMGFRKLILFKEYNNLFIEVLYTISYTIICFIISFALVIALEFFGNIFKKISYSVFKDKNYINLFPFKQ